MTPELERPFHKTIKKVGEDIEAVKFNTAIAAMMALLNTVTEVGKLTRDELVTFARLLSPFAPHIAEEVNEMMGNRDLISLSPWPTYDPAKTADDTVELPVQLNGKVRATIRVAKDADKDTILAEARGALGTSLDGKTVIKEIVVPGKIVNLVVK